MKRRKICVVTGSRADYGLLFSLLSSVRLDHSLELVLVVTGSHLSQRLGMTYRELQKDNFIINYKVPVLCFADDDVGITKAIGRGCAKFADVFKHAEPDMVAVLGDRFEIFAAAVAAYTLKIPIAHIHGGETTQGAIDEAYRHAMTKMACVHFTTTELYRRRVIQMGESPSRVFTVGSPSLDVLYHQSLLSRQELLSDLGLDDTRPLVLVTYHPVTLEKEGPELQLKQILKVLATLQGQIVFTKANADPLGERINRVLFDFCRKKKNTVLVANLGHKRYLSCLKHFDLMIGNSSSGIIEAPSFALPVVNIGDRQKGRIRGKNVIDVPCEAKAIDRAVHQGLSAAFRKSLELHKNPYDPFGDGKAGERIKNVIKKFRIGPDSLKKEFFDITYQIREN